MERGRSLLEKDRSYRALTRGGGGVSFVAVEKETDLLIRTDRDLPEDALRSIRRHRGELEGYIAVDLTFARTLKPHIVMDFAPAIAREMAEAGKLAGVGPMAAVAGAIAERVGRDLLEHSRQVVVENGGDLFLALREPCWVALYAGDSPFSLKLALRVAPAMTPMGICTSAATVGPSLSFGRADAACVLARSAAVADAFATTVGNAVRSPEDVPAALEMCQRSGHVLGVVIAIGETLGAWGQVDLVELDGGTGMRNPGGSVPRPRGV